MDEKGLGTQKDLNNAIELYTNACDGGNSSACLIYLQFMKNKMIILKM